jgi:hypothetical protein
MRHSWMLGALVGVTLASPAVAQQKIAPSVEYRSVPPTPLDKNYGLPTFGQQGTELPRKRATAPEPQQADRPDPFQGLTGFGVPPAQTTDDTPDFFAGSTDITLPKARKGAAATETPLFTTTEGASTEDAPFDRSPGTDSPFNRSRSSDTLADGPWAGDATTASGTAGGNR